MRKYLNLVLAVIVGLDVFMSFVRDQEVEVVFGIEINVWLYRLLWGLLSILLLKGFIQELQKEKTNQK